MALRALMFALLALGLMLRPVLESVGGLHEMAHEPGDPHGLVVDGGHAAGGTTAHEEDAGGSPLHVLAHIAHCCGQATVLPLVSIALPHGAATGAGPIGFDSQLPRPALAIAPFRPPIAA